MEYGRSQNQVHQLHIADHVFFMSVCILNLWSMRNRSTLMWGNVIKTGNILIITGADATTALRASECIVVFILLYIFSIVEYTCYSVSSQTHVPNLRRSQKVSSASSTSMLRISIWRLWTQTIGWPQYTHDPRYHKHTLIF